MRKNIEHFRFIQKHLQNNHRVAFFVVVESHGSSPGKKGFKLSVSETGACFGTIGGGIMEKNLIEQAFNGGDFQHFDLAHNADPKEKTPSGLICSGEQRIFKVILSKKDLMMIENILASNKAFLINEKSLQLWNFDSKISFEHGSYIEPIHNTKKLYICGGGHVGLAISKVASMLDFEITIFDDRENLHTLNENHFVHQKIICPFSEISSYITLSEQSSVVIVTKNMMSDFSCLKALAHKHFFYLGLMGSSAKIFKIKQLMIEKNVDLSILDQLKAPIGLRIGASTPEEIAISIVGELIAHHAAHN